MAVETEVEEKQIERLEIFGNIVIFVGVFCIILGVGMIINEIFLGSLHFCKAQDGKFSIKFLDDGKFCVNYFCDGKKIAKYDDGWDFEHKRNFNFGPLILD